MVRLIPWRAALAAAALLLAGVPAARRPSGGAQPEPLTQIGLDPAGRPRYTGVLTLQDALGLGLRENLGIALGQAETRMAAAMGRTATRGSPGTRPSCAPAPSGCARS